MPSAPDTISSGNGMAATYPSNNRLLSHLKLTEVPLEQEEDIHACAALGPCLPIALTYQDSSGGEFAEPAYERLVEKYALPNPREMIAWARSFQRKDLQGKALRSSLDRATTPAGITQAVVTAISDGVPLRVALENGLNGSNGLAE